MYLWIKIINIVAMVIASIVINNLDDTNRIQNHISNAIFIFVFILAAVTCITPTLY